MRLRILSCGTILWERFCILKSARKNPWIFRKIINHARSYTESMGIQTVKILVKDPRLIKMYLAYGFKITEGVEDAIYTDGAYTNLHLHLDIRGH